MNRVEALADRPEGFVPPGAPSFRRMVPLDEILSEALDKGTATQAVSREYQALIKTFGSEFGVLIDASEDELRKGAPAKIAEGIVRMRAGQVSVEPGYDGEYGSVKMFGEGAAAAPVPAGDQQMTLF